MTTETETGQERMWADVEPEARASSSAPAAAEVPGAPRLQAVNRQQMVWRAVDVERLIEEDHPARAIWELVGQLDLSAFREAIDAVEGKAGRPALDPQLLISLWIYAYSEGVGSAREIARRCEYDPAYQWLTGLEPINYHSSVGFSGGPPSGARRVVHAGVGIAQRRGAGDLAAGDARRDQGEGLCGRRHLSA